MAFDSTGEPERKIDRLLLIADALETVAVRPGNLYRQGTWRHRDPHTCQTTACALGWGLTKYPDAFGRLRFRAAAPGWDYSTLDDEPYFDRADAVYGLIAEELGITRDEAGDYFGGGAAYCPENKSPRNIDDPLHVAQKLRELYAVKLEELRVGVR